jgi:DNA-binding transcriptional regulator LsrR (DeoR family)
LRGFIHVHKKIRAKAMAVDVHAGMGDSELMKKYGLSSKQLERLLRKLLDAGLITDMQFYERTSLSDSQLTLAFVDSEHAVGEMA